MAFNNYKLQYDALPGDHSDAADYFGSSNYYCQISANHCNGNGDNKICYGACGGPAYTGQETIKYWAHMESSQILPVKYAITQAGVNLGKQASSTYNNACWRTIYETLLGKTRHAFRFGSFANNNYCLDPIFTTAEAVSIDKKIDDGHGADGKVLARSVGSNGDCVTVGNYALPTTTTYNLSTKTVSCAMSFAID